jgi:hypothetical protein
MNEDNFARIISFIQVSLNNSDNAFTDLSSNEILYEFKVRESLDLLKVDDENSSTFLKEKRFIVRKEAEEAIFFVNAQMKIRYDSIRTSLNLNVDDKVFLKLHKNYTQSSIINRKFDKQRLRSVKILEKIDRLIYRLDILTI